MRCALVAVFLISALLLGVSCARRMTPEHHAHAARHLMTRDQAEIFAASNEEFNNAHDHTSLELMGHLHTLISHAVQGSTPVAQMSDSDAQRFEESWIQAQEEDPFYDEAGDQDDREMTMQAELAAQRAKHANQGPGRLELERKTGALYTPFEAVLARNVRYARQPHDVFHGIQSVVDAMIDDEIIRLSLQPDGLIGEQQETMIMHDGGAQSIRIVDHYLYNFMPDDKPYTEREQRRRSDMRVYFVKAHRARPEYDPLSGPEPEPPADAPWVIYDIESLPSIHNAAIDSEPFGEVVTAQ